MNVENLEAKVEAAKEKVAKIESTIERHKKAKEKKRSELNKIIDQYNLNVNFDEIREKDPRWYFNYRDEHFYSELSWAVSDVEDKEDAIKESTKKLEEAKKILKNWEEKLNLEKGKMQYIQDSIPQVIKDFLLEWKNNTIKFIQDLRDTYEVDAKAFKEERNKIYYDFIVENEEKFSYLKNKLYEYDPEYNYFSLVTSYRDIQQIKSTSRYCILEGNFKSKYSDNVFQAYRTRRWDDEWLDSVITEEMNRKLVQLMNKVCKITGELINADLYIEKGDLNGIAVGKEGKARVTTIGAGGYNIQRFHYRVLTKPIKDDK